MYHPDALQDNKGKKQTSPTIMRLYTYYDRAEHNGSLVCLREDLPSRGRSRVWPENKQPVGCVPTSTNTKFSAHRKRKLVALFILHVIMMTYYFSPPGARDCYQVTNIQNSAMDLAVINQKLWVAVFAEAEALARAYSSMHWMARYVGRWLFMIWLIRRCRQ